MRLRSYIAQSTPRLENSNFLTSISSSIFQLWVSQKRSSPPSIFWVPCRKKLRSSLNSRVKLKTTYLNIIYYEMRAWLQDDQLSWRRIWHCVPFLILYLCLGSVSRKKLWDYQGSYSRLYNRRTLWDLWKPLLNTSWTFVVPWTRGTRSEQMKVSLRQNFSHVLFTY